MDAYDIFKKITRGAKFTKRKKVPDEKEHTPLEPSISIKTEAETPPARTDDIEDANDNTLTLLGPITAPENPQRAKKRKSTTKNHNENKLKMLQEEKVNRVRNRLHVSVVGKNVPEPIETFEEFAVKPDIIHNLRGCGYTEPTPIQKQAIPAMLEGRQVLACAPTGSGKTAAFLVPIIHHLKGPQKQGFRAVVLCPTRELATQTQRECVRLAEGRGLRIHTISKHESKGSHKFDVLVTTPNRLCFLLNQDPPGVSLANVEWLIVDEADKLFESGVRSFRDQLERILGSCTHERRKIAMFSATHMPVVAKWCCRNMKGLIRITVGQRNAATDLVDQKLLFVGNESGKLLAFRDLVRTGLTPPVLVFVQSKERAQQLFSELIYDGINVDAIHADRTQTQRDNTVRSFREGKIWILIATELMARGIDFKGVNLVVNYDFPTSAVSYVHRVGRAGRAGRRGSAVTFFTIDDTVNLRSIAHVIRGSGCEVPDYMLKMRKRSRRDVKKLKGSAPERDDITTAPTYDREKRARRMRRSEGSRLALAAQQNGAE